MNSSHEHLYYLDPWFLAREYELQTNCSMPSSIRRSSNTHAGGSLGFLHGHVAMQESIEFQQTPEKAFREISPRLEEFPEIEPSPEITPPSIFWVRGVLGPYGQRSTRSGEGKTEVMEDIWTFSIILKEQKHYIRLLAEDSHFRYNIHRILSNPRTLGRFFRPRVRALVKSHGRVNEKGLHLATPLVIIETPDADADT